MIVNTKKHIELLALPVAQTYNIDWGDGTAIEQVPSLPNIKTIVTHDYQFVDNMSATLIVVTTDTGGYLEIPYVPNYFGGYANINTFDVNFNIDNITDGFTKTINSSSEHYEKYLRYAKTRVNQSEYDITHPNAEFVYAVSTTIMEVILHIEYAGATPNQTITYYKANRFDESYWNDLTPTTLSSAIVWNYPLITDIVTINWECKTNYGDITYMDPVVIELVDGEAQGI